MDLLNMLINSGGGKSVDQIAGATGLNSSQMGDVVSALAPALMRGLQKQTESSEGLSGLQNALASGNHRQYLDQPELIQSDDTREDGNRILGHIFGSKDVSRNVAAQAAEKTGVDAGMIKKALPLLAGLAMGAISKETGASGKPSTDMLGGLLGGLMGGDDNDSGGLDDMLQLARKFF